MWVYANLIKGTGNITANGGDGAFHYDTHGFPATPSQGGGGDGSFTNVNRRPTTLLPPLSLRAIIILAARCQRPGGDDGEGGDCGAAGGRARVGDVDGGGGDGGGGQVCECTCVLNCCCCCCCCCCCVLKTLLG